MRIFLLSQHSLPEPPPIAHMVAEFGNHLVKRGHDVHLITGFPSYPDGKLYDGFKRRSVVHESKNGIQICRVWSSIYGKQVLRRASFFTTWSCSARLFGRKLPRPEVIYTETPPPSSAEAAISLARSFNCPVVARVQDVHPDSSIASGFIRNSLLRRLLRKQEQKIYSKLDKILVIGKGLCETLVKKDVPREKISICPNWIDLHQISPRVKYPNPVRDRLGIPKQKRIALYAGTLGRSHGTGVLLDAAKQLQNVQGMEDLLLVFVGTGHERVELESRIRKEKIPNVIRFDPVERRDLPDMLSMADLGFVCLKPKFGNLSVPSKTLGYMAAGKPVLAIVPQESDTAELVREAACGEILEPNNPAIVADAIQRWIRDSELCRRTGEAARHYCESHLHHNRLMDKLASELETMAR